MRKLTDIKPVPTVRTSEDWKMRSTKLSKGRMPTSIGCARRRNVFDIARIYWSPDLSEVEKAARRMTEWGVTEQLDDQA
jgi:hypothetical protein